LINLQSGFNVWQPLTPYEQGVDPKEKFVSTSPAYHESEQSQNEPLLIALNKTQRGGGEADSRSSSKLDFKSAKIKDLQLLASYYAVRLKLAYAERSG
jgi:hypothetical protein